MRKSDTYKYNAVGGRGLKSSSREIIINDFADHFKHMSNSPHSDRVFEVPDSESQNIEIEILDQRISVEDFSNLKGIDSLKRGKSPGIDGLLGDFFKDARSCILPYRTIFFIREFIQKFDRKG